MELAGRLPDCILFGKQLLRRKNRARYNVSPQKYWKLRNG